MTIAGLVGGIGPESTIEYYRGILAGWRAARGDDSAPNLVIDSIDVQRGLRYLAVGDLDGLVAYLAESVARLAAAGCSFVALAANSPHVVFDALAARSTVPLVSIVEATADALVARGVSRVTLLGTRFTMESAMYPDALARRGITCIRPTPEEMDRVHAIYVGELLANRFLDTSRDAVLGVLARLRRDADVRCAVLAGTELPLLLRADVWGGIALVDSGRVHVDAIVARLVAGD